MRPRVQTPVPPKTKKKKGGHDDLLKNLPVSFYKHPNQ
jgi:hypothetical protein